MFFFIIIKHNSKRINKKNFRRLGKYQMWEHLILSLKKCNVFIDTDSPLVINRCKKFYPWVKVLAGKIIHG